MYKIKEYKSIAQHINNRIYTDYFYRLMLISKSLFEWHNLPNGIDERWIERYLFTEGQCLFFKDPNIGFMVTKLGDSGPLNYYDEPTDVKPYAVNWIYDGPQLVNNENCVIIRNNDDGVPTLPTIQIFAKKLTDVDRTIDVNIDSMKTPVIILCSDKQKLSLKNVMKQRADNETAIYGDKNLDINQIKTLDLKAPIVFDKLQIQKHGIWNECMTFLGINNANMDKRERLVTDEVSANDEQIRASEDTMLKTREHACKLINEMFGTNIYVTRRRLENPLIKLDEDNELLEMVGEE